MQNDKITQVTKPNTQKCQSISSTSLHRTEVPWKQQVTLYSSKSTEDGSSVARTVEHNPTFLIYLIVWSNMNIRILENIKVSKPSVSKSQTLFNKVFRSISHFSCFIFAKNFHRQCTTRIIFLEKKGRAEQPITNMHFL